MVDYSVFTASAGLTRAIFVMRNTTVSAVTSVTDRNSPAQNHGP